MMAIHPRGFAVEAMIAGKQLPKSFDVATVSCPQFEG